MNAIVISMVDSWTGDVKCGHCETITHVSEWKKNSDKIGNNIVICPMCHLSSILIDCDAQPNDIIEIPDYLYDNEQGEFKND
jgi:hypothetical protein